MPPVRTVYAVANHKGGVGKTTTAVNLAACLAELGKRVLLIDLDPQGHASEHLGAKLADTDHTPVAKLLIGMTPLEEAWKATSFGFDLVAGGLRTSLAASHLSAEPQDCGVLRTQIAEASTSWDAILLDCPPTFGPILQAAFRAARGVVVPMQLEYLALSGFADLLATVDRERQHNRELVVSAWFAIRPDNSVLARDVRAALEQTCPSPAAFDTVIRKDTKLAAAPSSAQPITAYAPKTNGAADYRALAKEFCARGLV